MLSVPAQNTIGEIAGDDATKRVIYLGWYALGHAISSVVSPVIVGYCIDHYGFRYAYTFQLLTACLALGILWAHRKLFQQQGRIKTWDKVIPKAGIRSLLTTPGIKRIYIISLLFSIVWDLYTFLVPILGKKIGLSATAIGTVVSAFAIGIMFVRLIMPLLAKRFNEWEILRASMIIVVVVYAALPWAVAAWQLMIGGFFLGCALGCSQPNMLSLLHQASPPGRAGEAVGLRMSFGSASSVFVPLLFGVSAASFGLLPIFWLMAAAFAGALPQVHRQVYKNKD
jgi:MFS family permease